MGSGSGSAPQATTALGLPTAGRPTTPAAAGPHRHQLLPDHLQQRLRQHPQPDTGRVNRLNALALLLRTNDPAQSAALFGQALALATRLHYLAGQAHARFGLGYHYREQSHYGPARTYTLAAYQNYVCLHDAPNQVRALYGLARIYTEQGLYGQALATSLDGLRLAQSQHDQRGELFMLTQLGQTSTALGEYDQAGRYLRQTLALAQRLSDPIGSGHAYTALGELSQQQQQWAAAQHYYQLALRSYQPVYNEQGLLASRIYLVAMAERQGRAHQALAVGRQLLPQATKPTDAARLHLVLARASLQAGQLDSTRRHGETGLRIGRASGLKELSAHASQALAEVAARQGRFEAAYQYQQLAGAYADSLTGNATRRRVAALTFRARQERTRSQARLRAQQQQLRLLRQQRQAAALTGLLLLLAALSAWGVRRYQRQQRAREAALRTRLAADLRNDVGTLLSQISEQSNRLQEGLADGESQRQQLSQLSDASRSAVRQLNDVVWSLEAQNDGLADLLDRLQAYAAEVLGAAGVAVTFHFPAPLPAHCLPLLLRRNVYLIYKESLHNILRHGVGATAVAVSVQLVAGSTMQLALEVRDNSPARTSIARSAQPGLQSIKARTQALGGEMYTGGSPEGFRVYVLVPLTTGWNAPRRYRQA